jgi:hypothetical protein
MAVNPNEIKKGERVRMNNGWEGTMKDGRKGPTRDVEVEGIVTETGSVYVADIVAVKRDGEWVDVVSNEKQKRPRDIMNQIFGS